MLGIVQEDNTIRCNVQVDDILSDVCRPFDYSFSGESVFHIPKFTAPRRDGTWGIGLIVGPSGSGKSVLLDSCYGLTDQQPWEENKAVASHFASAEDAVTMLSGVGLNTVPSWCKPFHALSTGEQFRASVARNIGTDTAFDEFTSVVDRNVAKSVAAAVRRLVDSRGMTGVVLATCHYDITEFLNPDWMFNTATGQFCSGRSLRRPEISVTLTPCSAQEWATFAPHHYLTGSLNRSSHCWLATWNGVVVGFSSAIAYPSGTIKEKSWREHRTVVLPDFQGMGIGVRLSDAVAGYYKALGCRFFSKTSHPRMGQYREHSPLWKPTSKNRRDRQDYGIKRNTKESGYSHLHQHRTCWSHEYIGN